MNNNFCSRSPGLRKVMITAVQIGLLSLAACSEPQGNSTGAIADRLLSDQPADRFMANIAQYCGQSFTGRVAANTPVSYTHLTLPTTPYV